MFELIIVGIVICWIVDKIAEHDAGNLIEGIVGFVLMIVAVVIVFTVFSML